MFSYSAGVSSSAAAQNEVYKHAYIYFVAWLGHLCEQRYRCGGGHPARATSGEQWNAASHPRSRAISLRQRRIWRHDDTQGRCRRQREPRVGDAILLVQARAFCSNSGHARERPVPHIGRVRRRRRKARRAGYACFSVLMGRTSRGVRTATCADPRRRLQRTTSAQISVLPQSRLANVISPKLAGCSDSAARAGFAASMLVGVIIGRCIIQTSALAVADQEAMVRMVGAAIGQILRDPAPLKSLRRA